MATPKIFEAMVLVMDEIEAIGKDKTNAQQGFKYRGIDQVYNDLHPLLAKHKIFTTPKVIANEREERTNTKGTTLFYSRVTMQYAFWTVDGSSVECSVIGEGMDSGDKSTNKAMAIAHKYALLQTFCIPTEDMPDPDAQVHEVKPQYKTPSKAAEDEINAYKKEFAEMCKPFGITAKENFDDFFIWLGWLDEKERTANIIKCLKHKPDFINQLETYKEARDEQ